MVSRSGLALARRPVGALVVQLACDDAAQLLECACKRVIVSTQVDEAFAPEHLDEPIECGTQPRARVRRLYAYDWNIIAIGKRADMMQQVEHPHFVEIQVDDNHLEQTLAKGSLSFVERSYERRAAIGQALEQPIVKVGRCNKDFGGCCRCHG